MKKELAAPTIDFADSTYKSIQLLEDRTLIIYMDSWQEKPLKLIFKDVIYLINSVSNFPKDLYEVLESHILLEKAVSILYEKKPDEHPYKLFQFEDIDDFPFIQVVAQSVNVIKEEQSS